MHELSLAGGIVSMVEAAAAREDFRRVAQLRLEIGALAGVEPQALRFALTAMMPGTCLAGGEITIDEIAGMASCLHCGASVEIESHTEACSRCGQFTLKATAGTGLRVVDILVFDD
ncbi:hydrogenase expression/synthesis hypA family protein [Paraburkholderia xenovorans LB400]|uniref:Hydrogenase maturation factor HypA n=1 Tax=Paraburkholderia xenovorans (strain LB400) TaxID=266265 RepID=Q13HK6_PARXL|nr:hydrogenase maturation nickel metallochaperone HypA [Paraburkholderia xenovorans]ABE36433.1 Putative hydrogenase expression/synthesis protein HypA [Paraburkholderia xenovorans LB400]AIP35056.1 hydrogenase expression/synthesis hypA family protein [Paraburkholderia xenovorans LB400]